MVTPVCLVSKGVRLATDSIAAVVPPGLIAESIRRSTHRGSVAAPAGGVTEAVRTAPSGLRRSVAKEDEREE